MTLLILDEHRKKAPKKKPPKRKSAKKKTTRRKRPKRKTAGARKPFNPKTDLYVIARAYWKNGRKKGAPVAELTRTTPLKAARALVRTLPKMEPASISKGEAVLYAVPKTGGRRLLARATGTTPKEAAKALVNAIK